MRLAETHLNCASIFFDVEDISNYNLFLQDRLIDTRVQAKLLCSLDSFETNDDMRDGLAVATQRILCLGWSELGDFTLVNFFGFLYTNSYLVQSSQLSLCISTAEEL